MGRAFNRGERIFIPGGPGEPSGVIDSVLAGEGLEIFTSSVPGVNRLHPELIGAGTRLSGLFMAPELAAAQREGTYRHVPMSYAAALKWLREGPPFDCAVVQVAPGDEAGRYSLGPAAEFTPEVLRRASRRLVVVNQNVPRLVRSASIQIRDGDLVVATDTPLVTYATGGIAGPEVAIARALAPYIEDGATLQLGLGKVPHALADALRSHRGLRLHSGMLSDGIMALAENGALDHTWEHSTTVLLGSPELYDWAQQRSDLYVRGVEFTHDLRRLAGIERFVAVNSALEVDLFGQCNLEMAGGRAVSGAGGAPDFARAAHLSPGGLSIVAMPATFGEPARSRVCARLSGVSTLSRTDVDIVVTDAGVADLRGLSVHERAMALINVAAPSLRADLSEAWRQIARAL
jgi:acyl-CoA hydrolase